MFLYIGIFGTQGSTLKIYHEYNEVTKKSVLCTVPSTSSFFVCFFACLFWLSEKLVN